MNRSSLEICKGIIEKLLDDPSPMTHIMYRNNLAYGQGKRYVAWLIHSELIVSNGDKGNGSRYSVSNNGIYYVTEKGKEFLMVATMSLKLLGVEPNGS